jgi:hypothetical protein
MTWPDKRSIEKESNELHINIFFIQISYLQIIMISATDTSGITLIAKLSQTAQVFSNYIKLKVDDTSILDGMKIGMFESIRDNGNLEGVFLRIDNCQAYPVHRDRTLFHRQVTLSSHSGIKSILESVVPASVGFSYLLAYCGLIDVTLYNMAIEPAIHLHASLQIDLVTNLQQAQV